MTQIEPDESSGVSQMEPHGTPCIGISVVVRSISDLRPPQSWQLLVKEHWFYLKMRIRFLITRDDEGRLACLARTTRPGLFSP
jgi:hypothetical protein